MIPIKTGDWFGKFDTKEAAKRHLTVNWTGDRVPDHNNWQGSILNLGDTWRVRVDFVTYPICESSDSNLTVRDCWCAECTEYRKAAKRLEVGLATYLNAVTTY